MIDHARRLIFIHVARTGGTSIETALVGQDWWNIEQTTKHLSARQARELYGEDIWTSYRKFSAVRNPWDRVVSMWASGWWSKADASDRLDPKADLRRFISELAPHPHESYRSLHYHEILNEKLDFIIRFETIQADFSRMLGAFGLPDLKVPHIEGRDRGNYRDYFDEASAAAVGDMFSRDIEDYGYGF